VNALSPFHALIVAAGRGVRAGLDVPKQFANLGGRAALRWSTEVFTGHPACVGVTVVVAPDDEARRLAAAALGGLAVTLVDGGTERQQSVAAGLAALDERAALVLVHDAARPGVDAAVIDRLLAAFADPEVAGAVPVLAVADTLARGCGTIDDIVDRSGLVRVQTPQAFRLGALREALATWGKGPASDETQVVRAADGRVAMVEGSRMLDKITQPGDLEHMAILLGVEQDGSVMAWRQAVGSGFDVHRLIPGDGLWLGGVFIAHDRALDGHSDADVALHAITDALLGAIGEGDIGQHFPPSDPQWRGAASDRFLAHACSLARGKGGRIDHIDCTIICEAPKVGPHRAAIAARIAEICALRIDHVSIKATTTERLGFTGRGEGIAAQAVASVALPVAREQTR
jgi:2-C-methyl-D-erythritol 4-phosphate cytidylyltransferase / 2-C-methyl-D-erythritol 2,4-cyclodiphosphate synthase